MSTSQAGWRAYIAEFHAGLPGITEEILARCTDGGATPYDWLVDGVDPTLPILDLACGSGPARPSHADRWVGLDMSRDELGRARSAGRRALVLGDATRIPLADDAVDVVTCSMALMLVDPLDRALGEVRRVLRPGGELRLLLPSRGPLRARDRARYARLFWAARSTTTFPPTPLRRRAVETLGRHGLQAVEDGSRRFVLPLDEPADVARFVDSWYRPGTTDERRARARARAGRQAPTTLGIPFRRIVAVA